jgi:rod shape-determining protein MreC
MKRVEIPLVARNFFVWVLLCLLLITAEWLGWLGFIRNGVESFLVPLEGVVYSSSQVIRTPVEIVRFWRSGSSRIADLERQVVELTVDATKVRELKAENEAMRGLLGAPLPKNWKFAPGAVIGRGDNVALGVGFNSGVEKGDAVVWEDILIGTVESVSFRQSKLFLLSHPNSKISVYIPSTKAEGLLVGRFGSQIVITQVLQEEEINVEDVVVTNGAIGAPKGLIIGKVSEIISTQTDVFKEALVEPLVEVQDLHTAFVVVKSDS